MNLLAPIAIALALLSVIAFQGWRLDRAQEKAAQWKVAVEDHAKKIEEHRAELNKCEVAAAENIAKAEVAKRRADEAAGRILTLRERLEQRLETMKDESTQLHERVEADCPAANDPDFIGSLYNDSP